MGLDLTIAERGAIYNTGRAAQLKDYTGLRFGNITPTDLDGYIDYQDRLWVVMEFKYGDNEMPYGQRLAVTRLCQDLSRVKPTLGILASHYHPSSEQIDCAQAHVVEVWYDGKWWKPQEQATARAVVQDFIFRTHKHLLGARPIHHKVDLRCGTTGQRCTFCEGVPCENSVAWQP